MFSGTVRVDALVSLYFIFRLLPAIKRPEAARNIDYVGAALFTAAIGPFLAASAWKKVKLDLSPDDSATSPPFPVPGVWCCDLNADAIAGSLALLAAAAYAWRRDRVRLGPRRAVPGQSSI